MPVPLPMLKAVERRLAFEYGRGRELFPFQPGAARLLDLCPNLRPDSGLDEMAEVGDRLALNSTRFYPPAPSSVPFERDGWAIRYPSRGYTDHEVNRHGHLAYAPAGPGCPMVLLIPAWNTMRRSFRALLPMGRASRFGGAALTLPYHEERMPEGWTYAQPLACPDLGLTLRAMQQAVLDAMDAITVLHQLGHEHIVVLGFSIGAGVSVLLDAHDPRPAGVISVLCADSFADCAWNGCSTEYLRAALAPNVDLQTLRRVWRPLEFGRFVPRLSERRRLVRALVTGRNDYTFPRVNALRLRALYHQHEIAHTWKTLACGHYTLQYPPFSYSFALWLRRRLVEVAIKLQCGESYGLTPSRPSVA